MNRGGPPNTVDVPVDLYLNQKFNQYLFIINYFSSLIISSKDVNDEQFEQ